MLRRSLVRAAVAGAVALVVVPCVALPLASDVLARRAETWMHAGRPTRAAALQLHAARLVPWRERGFTRLAEALYAAALRRRDPARAAHALESARRATEHAVRLEPAAGWAHANHARVLSRMALLSTGAGTAERALDAWEHALDLEGAHRTHLDEALGAARALGDDAHASRFSARRRAFFPEAGE